MATHCAINETDNETSVWGLLILIPLRDCFRLRHSLAVLKLSDGHVETKRGTKLMETCEQD